MMLNVGEIAWWISLLPPAWFAGFDDALAGSADDRFMAAGGHRRWRPPAAVLWLAFGKLAHDYETGLQR